MSAAPVAASAKATKGSSKSMVVGMLFLALTVGGGSAWFVQQRDRTAEVARAADSSTAPKYIVRLEGFTVNLADPEDTHFLRATIDLGVDHLPEDSDNDKPAQSLPVPRIRDAILSVLTLCKADELLTPDGKAKLKKDLIEALNKSVPELGVREIYFTEFLVQR
jgi:flagellar protein FliL